MIDKEQLVNHTCTATQRLDLTAVTGETEREDFHKIATPPHPLTREEDSDSLLSEQPCAE